MEIEDNQSTWDKSEFIKGQVVALKKLNYSNRGTATFLCGLGY